MPENLSRKFCFYSHPVLRTRRMNWRKDVGFTECQTDSYEVFVLKCCSSSCVGGGGVEEFSASPRQEYVTSLRWGYNACLADRGADNTSENDCPVSGLWWRWRVCGIGVVRNEILEAKGRHKAVSVTVIIRLRIICILQYGKFIES